MDEILTKTLLCCLLLALAGGCSLIPSKEELAQRAEQQRREQRQQALARISDYKTHCRELGFSGETGISNCQLELSIAYDAGVVLAMRNLYEARQFLDVANDFETALEGFRQLCSDVGFTPATEAYGNCVLKLQEANRKNIETAVNLREFQQTRYSGWAWAGFLAYTINNNK